jgi:two-component sensor histidine kinase
MKMTIINLWLVTNNGLLCYDPLTKKVKRYSMKNGLPDPELTVLHKIKDGFVSGFPGGLVIFDPQQLQKEATTPVPVFSSIYINDTIATHYFDPAPTIRYNKSIVFNFVSLNYNDPSQNQYAYKLQGMDNNWKYIGNENSLRFSGLPPGHYTLMVKAADSDGKWNEEPASFRFSVKPPFWKTWWFIGLCVVMIAGAVYVFYQYRLRSALKIERLRTRIATDLHDDIGATLSSISMYSEAVKKQVKDNLPHLEPVLEKMEESSRNMVNTMSDIVWTINPGNDAGERLVDRIESYAKDMAGVNEVRLNFSANERIKNLLLPLELRKNIYLVFKEAFTNALKYSKATELRVLLEATNGVLHLMVKDDGKGFNISQEFSGNGLKNMRLRSDEIGATLTILSTPGEGTEVNLHCKIT